MKQMIARFFCLWMLVCPTAGLCAGGAALAKRYIEVIPPQYDGASYFREGLAAVLTGEKWGFIDKTGKEVVPPRYSGVDDFRDGFATVRIGDWKSKTEKWGVIDKTGREIVPPQYDSIDDFHEELAAVEVGEKWGFIDTTGNEVVPCQYDAVFDFCEGLAAVMVGDLHMGKWGFIDKAGKEIVPPQYDTPSPWDLYSVYKFRDGLAAVMVDEKWGFIDKTGRDVVPVVYDEIGIFREGLASVMKDGMLGFVDETGMVVIPPTYSFWGEWDGSSEWEDWSAWSIARTEASFYRNVMPFFSEGLAAICGGDEHEGRYGYIDRAGNVIVPFEYDYAAPFSEGLAYVSKGGLISIRGAAPDVAIGGKFGYIDKTGEVVVPLVYDCDYEEHGVLLCWYFSDGFAQVSEGSAILGDMKYGMIDKTGNIVVPIQYGWVRSFCHGLAVVAFGGDYDGCYWNSVGLVDETGGEIAAVGAYDRIGDFYMRWEMAWSGEEYDFIGPEFVLVGRADGEDSGAFGYIDLTGKEVVPCIFDDARDFSEGLAAVEIDGKWGYIAVPQ